MFAPIFSLNLKHKIHPRTVTVGKYDGKHPCLSCGTTASKVYMLFGCMLIYCPQFKQSFCHIKYVSSNSQ